jgi:hypothetical protein
MGFSDDRRSSESEQQYEIGYQKPRRRSQYQPGQSGNPKGKPRGTKHRATVLKELLLEPMDVKQSGCLVRTTKVWVIGTQIVNQAVRGVYDSVKLVLTYGGFDRMFKQVEREEGGMSHETSQMIRAAFGGEEYVPEPPVSRPLPIHANKPASSDHTEEGQGYRVGRGHPPIWTRYQKGQSGNLAGRPRKTKSLEKIIQQQLAEQITFKENGRQRSLSKGDVILMQIVNKSAEGNVRFQALLFKYAGSLDLVLRRRPVSSKAQFEKICRDLESILN